MPSPIVSVQNLNLIFNLDIKRPWSVRDAFTRIAKNPASLFESTYNRLHVLNNISFNVEEGERVGIIGVNGSGKTSLCRCIAGMYRQTSGRIETQGPVRAIFDTSIGVQPELTGRENAELLVHFLFPEIDRKEASEIVEEALVFSELGEFIDAPYKIYSKGMQTRLFLSLISAKPTKLLILDEVFDGADSFFREKIATRVFNMMLNSGAVIFISHSADQVEKTCTRLIVLHQAQIAFDGNPKEALSVYESLYPKL